MYKLVIIDDEEMVRRGLTRLVELSDAGFSVAGEASSGSDGIEMVKRVLPDLIIVDVKMPGMTGLEMIDRVKEAHPDMKFIVLSGYTDYEYTRHALKSGASDYLKKPVNRVELTKLLLKVESELDQAQETRREKELIRELSDDLPFIKEKFFKELITEKELSPQQISQKLAALNIKSGLDSHCLVLIIRLDHFELSTSELLAQTKLVSAEAYRVFENSPENWHPEFLQGLAQHLTGIIIAKQNFEKFEAEVIKALNTLNVRFKELGLDLTVGIGGVAPSLLEIGKAFTQARLALKTCFYRGQGRMYSVSDIKTYPEADYQLLLEKQRPLLDKMVVQLISGEGALPVVEALWEVFKKNEYLPELVYKFTNNMMEYLALNLKRNGYPIHLDMETVGKEIPVSGTLDLLKKLVQKYFLTISSEISQLQINGERKIVEMAKEFIFANYSSNLSLETVALHVHMNSCYFSSLFKKETNENFINFVTRIRIEKAKEFLQNPDFKIYRICEMVGYTSPKHFTRLFKELVGLTPVEYRNKLKYQKNDP